VISWDVVNEAFDGGRWTPDDWREFLRANSPWYAAYQNGADASKGESGADYIYDAFVFARLADPDATLYYNDYNETENWKRESIGMMVEELNAKWKTDPRNERPARLLVEGIGMQSHYWVGNLNIADVDATIERFAQTGVKISVSELDIPAGTWSSQRTPPLTADEELAQAKLYARLSRCT
jgi:endo-1,4-beta-xylanase